MDKLVRKLRLIDGWQLGENESWLTDMAEQGFILKRLGAIFAYFQKGKPQVARYRFDVTFQKGVNAQRELFSEGGWDFVCRTGQINVYRSPETANVPELHSEPAEQAYTLQKLGKLMFSAAALAVIMVLFFASSQIFIFRLQKTPVISLIEGNNTNSLILCFLYLFTAYYQLTAAFSIHRLMSNMREGRLINHRAEWKTHRRFTAVGVLISLLLLLVMITLPITQIASLRSSETIPLNNNNPDILRLADIEQSPALERRTVYITDNGIDWGNRLQRGWSPLSPVRYEAHEDGVIESRKWQDNSGTYYPSFEYRYYKLTFPFMADALMFDLSESISSWNDIYDAEFPIIERSENGVNRFLTRESSDYREVFAHKGNVVIYVRYHGERTMDEIANSVIVFLANKVN